MNLMLRVETAPSRDVGRYLKHYFLLSFIITGVVQLTLISMPSNVGEMLKHRVPFQAGGIGVLRALAYFCAMYVFVVPPFAYLFHRKLKNYKPPFHTLIQKIIYTLFCTVLLGVICAFPFIFLLTENTSYGYPGFVYRVLTGSILGLPVIGALFSYAATLCFWLLFYAIPKMWISSANQTGEDHE